MNGAFHCLISDRDIRQVMSWALLKQDGPPPKVNGELQEGFARFLVLEIMHLVEGLNFVEDLVLRQAEREDFESGPYLCSDVTVSYHGQQVFARLALPKAFVESWRQRYDLGFKRHLTAGLAASISLEIGVDIGRSQFSIQQWQQIAHGDCIVPESFGMHAGAANAAVTLTMDQRDMFRGELDAQGNVKIVEFIPYPESKMDEETYDELDDDMLEDDLEEDEADLDEDLDLDLDEELEAGAISEEAEEAPAAAAPAAQPMTDAGMIPADKVPLQVVFELGRMQMSAQQLMNLQPGNLLELGVQPSEGVRLVINNRCVGRGELVAVGDAIGIRVLEKA